MNKAIAMVLGAMLLGTPTMKAQTMIEKNNITLASDQMTPEALWAMGRIGSYAVSPDGKTLVYQVSYYSVKENKSHTMLFVQPLKAGKRIAQATALTKDSKARQTPHGLRAARRSPSSATDSCGR